MKSKTHVFMAELIANDLRTMGVLNLPGVGIFRPPQDVVSAIVNYPGSFYAGAVGPDFYPEMFIGQSIIHPTNSGEWLTILFGEYGRMPNDHPDKVKSYAFILGFMMHYAGDMYGHYYVNAWAKGWFELSLDVEKIKIIARHILVESYMDQRVPPDKINTKFDAPINFLRECFTSSAVKNRYANTSFPMPLDLFMGLDKSIAEYANSNAGGILDVAGYFPGWHNDIGRATQDWLVVWQNVARIFTDNDANKSRRAKEALSGWANANLALMLGVPHWAESIVTSIAKIIDALNLLKPLKEKIEQLLFSYFQAYIFAITGVRVPTLDEALNYLKTIAENPKQYLNSGALYPDRNITDRLDAEFGDYGRSFNSVSQRFCAFYQCLNMCKLALVGPENLNSIIQKFAAGSPSPYAKLTYPIGIRRLGISIKTTANGWFDTFGTDDNVYFALVLKDGSKFEMLLDTPGRNDFENGQVDTFVFELPRSVALSEIVKIVLRKDYLVFSDDWRPQWLKLSNENGAVIFHADINSTLVGRTPKEISVTIPTPVNTVSIDPKILSFLYSLDGAGHDPRQNPTTELPWDNPGFPFYANAQLRQSVYTALFINPYPLQQLKTFKALIPIINCQTATEICAIGMADDAFWHIVKPGAGAWGNWTALGGIVKKLSVVKHASAGLAAFGIGTDDVVYCMSANPGSGAWSGSWTRFDGLVKRLACCTNAAGGFAVFGIGADDIPYYKRTASSGSGWENWVNLGGKLKDVGVARKNDGGVVVYGIGMDDALYCQYENPANGTFGGWINLGGIIKEALMVKNADGRLEAFAVGTDDALYHQAQTVVNGAWSGRWETLGGNVRGIDCIVCADGRMTALGIGTDTLAYCRNRSATGVWEANWTPIGQAKIWKMKALLNPAGMIEIFALATAESTVVHCTQTSVGWSNWENVG